MLPEHRNPHHRATPKRPAGSQYSSQPGAGQVQVPCQRLSGFLLSPTLWLPFLPIFPPATPASPFLELSRVADFLSCRSTPPVLWRKRSKVAISAPSQCPSRERSGFSVCFLFFSLWEAQQPFLWETGPSVSLGCRPGLDPARDKALAASHPPTSPATSPEDPARTQQQRDQSSSWSPWGCSAFWKSRAGSRARRELLGS